MPNIKPVSDLKNYKEVLKDVAVGEPVFLTKNGRGRYVIIDMEDYQKQEATLKLFAKLKEAEDSMKTGNEWLTNDLVKEELGL